MADDDIWKAWLGDTSPRELALAPVGREGCTAIGQVIRLARERKGLSQDELAQRLRRVAAEEGQHPQTTRRTVSRWERGCRIPQPAYRRWLAAVLDLTVEELNRAARASLSSSHGGSQRAAQPGVTPDVDVALAAQRGGVLVLAETERPIGLRPHIERAFESPHVSLDFAGFSGETLHGAIQEPLDKVRAGRVRPDSISLRALLPDTSAPMAIPCRCEDLADDPTLRERAFGIRMRHTQAIVDSIEELQELALVGSARARIRVHRCAPLFKLYILNQTEVFFGFYPVREHMVTINGVPRQIYDVLGKDTVLFHHRMAEDGAAMSSRYVQQAREWFDSLWESVARDLAP